MCNKNDTEQDKVQFIEDKAILRSLQNTRIYDALEQSIIHTSLLDQVCVRDSRSGNTLITN